MNSYDSLRVSIWRRLATCTSAQGRQTKFCWCHQQTVSAVSGVDNNNGACMSSLDDVNFKFAGLTAAVVATAMILRRATHSENALQMSIYRKSANNLAALGVMPGPSWGTRCAPPCFDLPASLANAV